MPSFQDSAVLVILALLLFGPKKLPVLARQLGKLMADFRRASNEFRSQMEEELRISEQAERQKQVAAIEAAAPPSPAIDTSATSEPDASYMTHEQLPESTSESESEAAQELKPDSPTEIPAEAAPAAADPAPLPIATSGELNIMPPTTGLPLSHTEPVNTPASDNQAHESELETETLHG